MGRTRFCSLLIEGKPIRKNQSETTSSLHKWKLSPAQTEAAILGLAFLEKTTTTMYDEPPCFLFWAVTGAGKTEMIFPLIEAELNRGKKVLVTTPRRDVVFELQPRLQKAFPDHSVVSLFGGSQQRWEKSNLILATTHQMLRFWHSFDLVIIDEIDAFPFHFNAMLEFAVQKACSSTGKYILLSATPPAHLQKKVKRNQLQHAMVSVRYHRYPLPVPKLIRLNSKNDPISIPRVMQQQLYQSLQRGAQIFLFIPKIKYIPILIEKLSNLFQNYSIDGASSKDSNRAQKIQAFREGSIQLLVTTTILERGVTVPKTDVFVFHADSKLFDESSLVQMAGRSGRAATDPRGRVFFLARDKTRSQVNAIKQIKHMNHLAQQKGYLIKQ